MSDVCHTYAGFRSVFVYVNKREPTGQEIFNAGMRGGRDIIWPSPPAPVDAEKFIALFEEIIAEDPTAYTRANETTYQVTRTELKNLFGTLIKRS